MQPTFLEPNAQPGDGAFLVQQAGKKHRRRKRGKRLKSFLEPSSDGTEDKSTVENSDSIQGKHHQQTFLNTYDRQEQTSLFQPHDSGFPKTIANKNLLSHDSHDDCLLPKSRVRKSSLHAVDGSGQLSAHANRFGQGYGAVGIPFQQALECSVKTSVLQAGSFGQGYGAVSIPSQYAVQYPVQSNGPQAQSFGENHISVPPPSQQAVECSGQLGMQQAYPFWQNHRSVQPSLRQADDCSATSGTLQTSLFRQNHTLVQLEDMATDHRARVLPPHLRKKAEKVQPEVESSCSVKNHDNNTVPKPASNHDANPDTTSKMRILKIASPTSTQEDSPKDSVINSPDQKSSKPPLVSYPSSHEAGQEHEVSQYVAGKGFQAKSSTNESNRGKPPSQRGPSGRGFATKSSTNESNRGKPSSRRGRGGRRGRQVRESRWPKASETRADPHRWDIKWESDENDDKSVTTVDSVCANAGRGEERKQKKQIENGIDPDIGFIPTDWSGKIAPAPLNWDARPAFRDGQSAQKIERWMVKIEEAMLGHLRALPMEDVTKDGITYRFAPQDSGFQIQGDPAPRYWIPVVFGRGTDQTKGQAPQTFWNELVRSKEPEPCDEDDLLGVMPWWQQYHLTGGHFLKPYVAPDIPGIDPDENEDEKIARENDFGSDQHTANRKRVEKAKREKKAKKLEKRRKAEERAQKLSQDLALGINENRIKPNIKLFIRSANSDDAPHLCKLYNHYIDNSVCTPETERRTDKDIHKLIAEARKNYLPFLVACEPGAKIPARKKKKNPDVEDIILPDKIIGFALAAPYNEVQGIYRFTVEIEFFTDKEYYMKAVAKCLLDKLLGLLDPDYVERCGYEVLGEDLDGSGAMRRVQSLVVNLPYDGGDTRRLEWMVPWLERGLGFEKVGNLPGVGVKGGKSVNLAIFLRKTGEVIEPHLCR